MHLCVACEGKDKRRSIEEAEWQRVRVFRQNESSSLKCLTSRLPGAKPPQYKLTAKDFFALRTFSHHTPPNSDSDIQCITNRLMCHTKKVKVQKAVGEGCRLGWREVKRE